ncbi:MAG: peptide chain release factor N(5)-glutamine methyltransferase [Actinomycetota bacterium]|nr:peptide chain release factor N(5)-glutamine methyltransferase [Actinomycetota bacterium]
MSEPTTIPELLALGTRVLSDSSHIFEDHDNAREARDLLALCLDVDADDLDDEDPAVPRRKRERYLSLVARRAGGEPLPFLTGRIEFWGLDLVVRPGAFVPRPSSELTVTRALRKLRRRNNPVVVDVCTGAGPIALALADELPTAEVWAADIAAEGLAQGRENARRLGLENIRFKKSDMYDRLPSRLRGDVDLITGHVPYVPLDEVEDLPAEVREFEPIYTLTDESFDGLGLMRRAVAESVEWLKPGGWLLLELSHDLPAKVRKLAKKAGLEDHGVARDEDDLSVVVEARKSLEGRRGPR